MKNTISNNLGFIIAASLSMASGVSQAAGLNTFSNGSVADADDVNHNFTYLNGRIDSVSTTPGPKGDQGIAGATGPVGATGLAGANGAVGAAGAQGNPGINGADGAIGPTGATGPAGAAGAQGNPGVNGADGAIGPTGATGPAGANGSGVITYSWVGFGNKAYDEKVFTVTGTHGAWDKEVRTFSRTSTGAGTGFNTVTRQRTLATVVTRHHVLRFDFDTNGDISFSEKQNFDTANTNLLIDTVGISPPIAVRTNAMGVGLRWGSAAQTTKTFPGGTPPDEITFAVDSRSLLAIEDITVNSVAYTGCQKIESIRSSEVLGRQHQRISWFCPNNVGLVKSIEIRSNGSGGVDSRVTEFDAVNSTLAAP